MDSGSYIPPTMVFCEPCDIDSFEAI